MRNDSFPDKKIKTDGSNLAGVLYHLCEDEMLKEQLLVFVKSLPEQYITNIICTKDKRSQVYFELEETFGNVKNVVS